MLDQLKQEDPAPETEAIKANIKKIVKICNDKYYNQSFFGSAALNRKMLLDPLITDLATPEVIRYLFTNNATKREMIVRNSGGNIALRDAIYHAFDDGLETIRLMPNNESQYGVNAYQRQKEAYEKHSKRMIQHIKVACQCDTAEVEDIVIAPNHPSLIDKLDHVVKVIEQITLNKASNKLLSVPGYRPTDIRKQTWRGLNRLCKIAGIKYGPYGAIAGIPSLDAFCEQILKSPEALLHGDVIHLFYDRAHLEAGLSARFGVSIAGKTYFYQDILRMMIKKIQKNPTWYPEAHEQFTVRLSIVANDLSRRFPDEIKMVYAASPTSSITLENALNEQDWEAILKIVHTKKLQEDDLKKIEQKAAAYGEWGLIYQCEKQKHPTERILTQGPLQKSLYTLQLEELTRKLLQTNQYQLVYLQNEQYILLQDGTRYNLSKILKYANFEHLNFTETDFNHYYRYHQSESIDKSNLFSWDCGYAPYKKL
ncbi:MAG: hypothetical protein Q8R79_07095 [Legionellaceae bacterium]|nr:hypothetical protein [Legionellaceae bacterium]